VKLVPLGVRGSTPAPGAAFVRYGGNTSCVAVGRSGAAAPTLLLDAGTGLRGLRRLLPAGAPFAGTVLLSHLHWDHVQGLPFCPEVDRDDARVDLWLPGDGTPEAATVLARAMSPPHFPIGPDGLRGRWRFGALAPGWHRLDGFAVLAAEVPHKGGRTYGYRVEADGVAVAYLPDHAPAEDLPAAVRELAAGVDVLLHDGQFLAAERGTAVAYGHSTVDEAVALAAVVGARRLVLTHHAPDRTDDQLDAIAAAVTAGRPPVPVELAAEGRGIAVGAHRGSGGGGWRAVDRPAAR
jgi:phosphoribosyl 1,2-cyclic phosphodiesterase